MAEAEAAKQIGLHERFEIGEAFEFGGRDQLRRFNLGEIRLLELKDVAFGAEADLQPQGKVFEVGRTPDIRLGRGGLAGRHQEAEFHADVAVDGLTSDGSLGELRGLIPGLFNHPLIFRKRKDDDGFGAGKGDLDGAIGLQVKGDFVHLHLLERREGAGEELFARGFLEVQVPAHLATGHGEGHGHLGPLLW